MSYDDRPVDPPRPVEARCHGIWVSGPSPCGAETSAAGGDTSSSRSYPPAPGSTKTTSDLGPGGPTTS